MKKLIYLSVVLVVALSMQAFSLKKVITGQDDQAETTAAGGTSSGNTTASDPGKTSPQTSKTFTSEAGRFSVTLPKACIGKLGEKVLGTKPYYNTMLTFFSDNSAVGCIVMYEEYTTKLAKDKMKYYDDFQGNVVASLAQGKLLSSKDHVVQELPARTFRVSGIVEGSKATYFQYTSIVGKPRTYLLIANSKNKLADLDSADVQSFFTSFQSTK